MDKKPSKVFPSIKQGLDEALEFSKNSKKKSVIHEFISVDTKVTHEEDESFKDEGPD